MKPMIKNIFSKTRRLLPMLMAAASLAATAHAAAPGITGPTFNLTANAGVPDPARWPGHLFVGLRL